MGFRMQDFTCDETKAKYPNSPHHPQHPPVHPLLHRGLSSSLLLLSPPSSSSSSARTRPPLQRSGWAHRGCSPLTVEHRAARRTAGKHFEQHRGAGQGALPFLFLTATWEFLWTTTKKEKEKKKRKKKQEKKKSRETCEGRRTTCRVSMASLMNSACLLFLPVALLLGEYPRQKINKNWYDSIETLNHQQCTTSTAAARASGVVLAARRCA